MKAKVTLAFSAIGALLWLLPDNANACSCMEFSPCEAFGYSSAVFIGQMIEGSEKVRESSQGGNTISYETGRVRFSVQESFKGVYGTEVTIYVLNLCGGHAFVRGATYLVYATNSDSVGLIVGPCSRTKGIDGAKADLDYLRSLPKEGTGGRLYGNVGLTTGDREPVPLPAVTLTVEDESGQSLQIKTDAAGNYEVNGLTPGKYLVRPLLPENYVPANEYQEKREVVVSDRGCTNATFGAQINGRIGGKVTDAFGRPAPADLTLSSVEKEDRNFLAYTDENGQYEFEGIPPGRYVLHIDFVTSEKRKEPFFYPGVTDRSEAIAVKIAMGEKLKGFDFTLPQKLQVKTVQGVVRYSDGRAAPNLEVRLILDRSIRPGTYTANNMYTDATTDGEGRFTLRGYKDVAYKILAFDNMGTAIREKRRQGKCEPVPLTLAKDLTDVAVTISLVQDDSTSPARASEAIRKTMSEGESIIDKVRGLKPEVNGEQSASTLGEVVERFSTQNGTYNLTSIGWEASGKWSGRWRIVYRYQDYLKQDHAAEWEYNPDTNKLYPFEFKNAPQFWHGKN